MTDKQRAFVRAYTIPGKGLNNATQAYKIAYPNTKAGHNKLGSRLMANDGVKGEIDKIRANLAAESEFTREKQLKALNTAQTIAKAAKNPAAMVSAIREQNEMLGFHRELAPNAEREAARKAKMDAEGRKVAEKVARMRTEEEAGEAKIVKIG